MRQKCFGLLGILTCVSLSVNADSFNETDMLLAGKDFPFPPDESDLPENAPQDQSQPQKSEKNINPEVQNKPQTGKDIFPPEESDLPPSSSSGRTNQGPRSERNINPEVQRKPQTGKDIFPPEES